MKHAGRAVLYLRTSTKEQTTSNQEGELRMWAERLGVEVVRVYADAARGASPPPSAFSPRARGAEEAKEQGAVSSSPVQPPAVKRRPKPHTLTAWRVDSGSGGHHVHSRGRVAGMPVRRHLVTVYTLSGLLAAFAGLVVIARVNAADSGTGEDLLLASIAAVVLGGSSLFGGQGGVVGTAVGSVILALVLNGMNLLDVKTFWQAFVLGAIVILSVLTDQLASGRLGRGRES